MLGMPRYRIEARDTMGRTWQAVVEAPDAGQAVTDLKQQGFHVSAATRTTDALHAPRLQAGARAAAVSAPSSRTLTPASTPVPSEVMDPPAQAPVDLAFRLWLYPQLAATLKAAQDPSVTVKGLASKRDRSIERQTLEAIARDLARGDALSLAMRRTGRFPAGDVGLVEASEAAGFLPEAFHELGDRALAERKMRRWGRNLVGVIGLSLPCLAVGWAGGRTLIGLWNQADRGETPNVASTAWAAFAFPILPVMVGLYLGLGLLWWWWLRPGRLEARHRRSASFGALGRWAQSEALVVFSDVLRRLSEAGVSPSEAWRLAAAAIPNRFLAREMATLGPRAGESTSLAARMRAAPFVPRAYADLVETGETTGTTPAALADVARAERMNLEDRTKAVGALVLRGVILTFVVTYGVAMMILAWIYARELIPSILSGFEVD